MACYCHRPARAYEWDAAAARWQPLCGIHARGRDVVRIERTADKMPDRKTRYWELLAPDGYQFSSGEHALICDSEVDAIERLRGTRIVRCQDDCDCRA